MSRSPFVLEKPEEFLKGHNYSRNYIETFTRFRMSSDLLAGLKMATENNQTQLAMQYVSLLFEVLKDILSAAEDEKSAALNFANAEKLVKANKVKSEATVVSE